MKLITGAALTQRHCCLRESQKGLITQFVCVAVIE